MNIKRLLKISALAVCVLIFATAQTRPSERSDNRLSGAYLQDLKILRNRLMNDVNDFEHMIKPLHGTEAEAAFRIDNEAQKAYLSLDASFWFFVVYDQLECEHDRQITRVLSKDRFEEYSERLENQINQITPQLPLMKLTAAVAMSGQIRDDLLATKLKLGEIAASLD